MTGLSQLVLGFCYSVLAQSTDPATHHCLLVPKVGGYASVLILIRELSRFWGMKHQAKFHWHCDSKAAISRVRCYASYCSTLTKMPNDADLLSVIRECHVDLRSNIRIHWVKGHQDASEDRRSTLSLASRLNILADSLAVNYCMTGRGKPSQATNYAAEQVCSIQINRHRLTGQYDACVRFHVNGYHFKQ
jgi:hypothetical protein